MSLSDADIATLRTLLLEQPQSAATRLLALLVSVAFLLAVLDLVRRRKLREEYTPIWVGTAVGILFCSVWFDGLRSLTRAVGAWTPSSTLFFFGELFLLVVCLNYAVKLSLVNSQVKALAQEIAILKAQIERRWQEPRSQE